MVIGSVALSGAADVEAAVTAARAALPKWRETTVKARARVMFKFHELVEAHMEELVGLVVAENGKNRSEAAASIAKARWAWACACACARARHTAVRLLSLLAACLCVCACARHTAVEFVGSVFVCMCV